MITLERDKIGDTYYIHLVSREEDGAVNKISFDYDEGVGIFNWLNDLLDEVYCDIYKDFYASREGVSHED